MAFSPNSNTKLKRWWDASDPKGDGTLYSDSQALGDSSHYWLDKIALTPLGQATSGQRPVFKVNIQNGLPGVLFDGVDDILTTTDATLVNLFSGSDKALSVITVSTAGEVVYWTSENNKNITTEIANPIVFAAGGDEGFIYSFGSTSSDYPFFGTRYNSTGVFKAEKRNNADVLKIASGGSYLDHEADIISTVNHGTTVDLYQNLVPVATGVAFSATTATVDTFAVGGLFRASSILNMKGYIFEVMVFNDILTAQELKDLNEYAGDKWAIFVRNKIKSDAQKMSGERLVKLYELDATGIGGSLYRFVSSVDATNQIASITSVSLTATCKTVTPHTLAMSDTISISGINNANYNGQFSVASIVDAYTFTYALFDGEAEPAQGVNMIMTRLNNLMVFGGNDYGPIAIETEGFEWTSQGSQPSPKIRVSNVAKVIAASVISLNDLVGAKLTRIRTFRKHLDDGTDPDTTSVFPREIYNINRKSVHNKVYLEFELTSPMDQQGVQIPGRQCIKRICTQVYRTWNGSSFDYSKATCPYTGSSYFTVTDQSTGSPTLDSCSKQLSSCKLRFGSAPLPTRAFPGIGGAS